MRRFLIPLLIFVGVARVASAADSTVTALPAASALTGPELSYCIQGAADKKCTATQIGAFANGVFNVRTQYGASPSASASANNTAILSAFTAANAFTNGVPTVYFDCDTSQTACVYSYNGSGLSPIQMLVPMAVLCAPGVTLNYGGSAHAAEMGPTTLTADTTDLYVITGCRFTGGASMTAGIYINNWVVHPRIIGNFFRNFGNQTGYTIAAAGPNNWEPWIRNNVWTDSDGFTKNMVDLHSATASSGLDFSDNMVECETALGAACSVATTGVGVWAVNGRISRNVIQYHYPLIRIASAGGNPMWIDANHLEGNFGGTKPAITYGDPGGTATNLNYAHITNNFLFWPVAANTNVFIGPEAPASGSYTFGNAWVMNNFISDSSTMSGTGKVIQTNGGSGFGYYEGNYFNNQPGDKSTANFIDSNQGQVNLWAVYSFQNNGGALANRLPVFDSNGVNLNMASAHNVSQPLVCTDASGSGTAQVCNTSPSSDVSGATITLQTGDMIHYHTTTTNTGALTVTVNGTAYSVKKTGGSAAVVAGDIKNTGYYPMIVNGTDLDAIIGQ